DPAPPEVLRTRPLKDLPESTAREVHHVRHRPRTESVAQAPSDCVIRPAVHDPPGRLVPPRVVAAQDRDSRPHLLENPPPPEGIRESVHALWIEGSMGADERGDDAFLRGGREAQARVGGAEVLLGPRMASWLAQAPNRVNELPAQHVDARHPVAEPVRISESAAVPGSRGPGNSQHADWEG